MEMSFSVKERAVLDGLLDDLSDDIILRLNEAGFIEDASPNIATLGIELSEWLLKPHVADLVQREYRHEIVHYSRQIIATGRTLQEGVDWVEFPLAHCTNAGRCRPDTRQCWFAMKMRSISQEEGGPRGALCVVRSVERLRSLQGQVFSRALIDPLTGLSNRHAFCAGLRRMLAQQTDAYLALFEVDRMRALLLQYGQQTADEIIWSFAKFLETMAQGDHEVAQFDGERFCVVLSGFSRAATLKWVRDVLDTFASLTFNTSGRAPRLSASAGVTAVASSVDWTLRQAELALVMARARGGMQVSECADNYTAFPDISLP